jgi:carbon-monoxide dehydrogenase medium subunit
VGLTNVGSTAVRATSVEQAMAQGATPEQAAEHASDGLSPSGDIRATPEYKLHLARVLTKRAIQQAA